MSFDPKGFAELMFRAVEAHETHGGWIETPEGLRCAKDGELVIPSAAWLMEGLE